MAHILYMPLLITSITTSSILTGCLFSLSYVSVSALLAIPGVPESLILSQWRTVFSRGFNICPTSAAFSGFCCFVNAFLTYIFERNSQGKVVPLIIAGSFMVGIVPYTLALIVPVEDALLKKETTMRGQPATLKNEKSGVETKVQLQSWAKLNYGRAALPLVGTLIAWSIW